jgi:mono/diheme cytochrome c family protein
MRRSYTSKSVRPAMAKMDKQKDQGQVQPRAKSSDPEWQVNVSDERLFNSITNGKGKMPSFGKKLSEQEINSLVAYVRILGK